MNEITTEQAVQMNRQEHVGMQQSLELLRKKAIVLDGQVEDDKEEVTEDGDTA